MLSLQPLLRRQVTTSSRRLVPTLRLKHHASSAKPQHLRIAEDAVSVQEDGAGASVATASHAQNWEVTVRSAVGNEEGEVGPLPSPHCILLTALGSSAAAHVRQFATAQKLDLESIRITVSRIRIKRKELSQINIPFDGHANADHKINLIDMAVNLHGSLSAASREALLRAAETCPIAAMLDNDHSDRELVMKYRLLDDTDHRTSAHHHRKRSYLPTRHRGHGN